MDGKMGPPRETHKEKGSEPTALTPLPQHGSLMGGILTLPRWPFPGGVCRRPSSSTSRHFVQAVINGVRAYLSPVVAAPRPHQSAGDEGKKIVAWPAAGIL
jgi:hypothetical protein